MRCEDDIFMPTIRFKLLHEELMTNYTNGHSHAFQDYSLKGYFWTAVIKIHHELIPEEAISNATSCQILLFVYNRPRSKFRPTRGLARQNASSLASGMCTEP
jgi:hypothetical protein